MGKMEKKIHYPHSFSVMIHNENKEIKDMSLVCI